MGRDVFLSSVLKLMMIYEDRGDLVKMMIKTNLRFELYSAKILYLILIQSDIV